MIKARVDVGQRVIMTSDNVGDDCHSRVHIKALASLARSCSSPLVCVCCLSGLCCAQ